MITVRLMNEFMHGPVWACEHGTGIEIDGFPLVLEDPVVSKLNVELGEMFDSYFCFDDDESCAFDEAKQREDKDKTLALLAELNSRLAEINDGTFEVEDLETPHVLAL